MMTTLLKSREAKNVKPEEHAKIIDVRSTDEYLTGHVPQSRNIPLDVLSAHADSLKQSSPVILICQKGTRSRQAFETLASLGVTDLTYIDGGIEAWKKARKPMSAVQASSMSIMRQVQIAVGILMLLATLHKPFRFLGLLLGGGMIYSGVTNQCGMAKLLAKMPWNNGGTCCFTGKNVLETGLKTGKALLKLAK
jgi:rhodanese-related sulfurtransferase